MNQTKLENHKTAQNKSRHSRETNAALEGLFTTFDLCVACNICVKRENDEVCVLRPVGHSCRHEVLLAKLQADGQKWKCISRRPKFPNPSKYEVCWYYNAKTGCTKHKYNCTFARSQEEAQLWTFWRNHNLTYGDFMHWMIKKQTVANKVGVRILSSEAEKIIQEFGGQFQEVCYFCFYNSPQQISAKGWDMHCASEMRHKWSPLLVCRLMRGLRVRYHEIRPLSSHCNLYCSHVRRGMQCWHDANDCKSAHSEVEMSVWKAEASGKLNRLELITLSQRWDPPTQSTSKIHCKACLLTFSTHDSFTKHCSSVEHASMISEDPVMDWKYRPPPVSGNFAICKRPDTCDYGDNCVYAHSKDELQEWYMRRRTAHKKRRTYEEHGLLSYRERLLDEYRNCGSEVLIMAEQLDDVTVSCDNKMIMLCKEKEKLMWNFTVESEMQLVYVALLKQEPGAMFTLGEDFKDFCSYDKGSTFYVSGVNYRVKVSFQSVTSGVYEQWVVFDFDSRPVLVQKIQATVCQHDEPTEANELCNETISPVTLLRWNSGNRLVIPYFIKTEEEQSLLTKYKSPVLMPHFKQNTGINVPITRLNYKDRMHSFLYREEYAEEEVLSRLSLQVTITPTNCVSNEVTGMKFSPNGELLAEVPVPYVLTPDTHEGYLLKRVVKSVYLAPCPKKNINVYEAAIRQDTGNEKNICLSISKRCIADLGLEIGKQHDVEIQFQMDRLYFCTCHLAVDLITNINGVFPDFASCTFPSGDTSILKLNPKQQAAISYITGDTFAQKPVAPLLIYGPFGTGKTFTLAKAAMETIRQPNTRVLICTHTNSAADLYVKDHFHPYVMSGHPEAKPLRVKFCAAKISSTDEITLQYCHMSDDKEKFTDPNSATLSAHRIIVTTAMMSKIFHDLNLPEGYFTHIMIDEASQMLECDALMPLSLAGPMTRIVLAGDHMQMGPKLFSVGDNQCSDYTLLNRLFHFYQREKHQLALKSRIIFNENYRSTGDIIKFVSVNFYTKEKHGIKASGKVTPHPEFYPLMFYNVHGTCSLDPLSRSWFNHEEVCKVAEIVEDLVQKWPQEWQKCSLDKICVVSEGAQVNLMRNELRKRKLARVTVENLANIQGIQFRVIIITTVQTRQSLLSSKLEHLSFFNDARALNTAMTRAQSLVVVVGDAAALWYFGNCSKIWANYIQLCLNNSSAHPESFNMEYVNQVIAEIAKFLKREDELDNDSDTESCSSELNDTLEDTILQELLDESKNIKVAVTEEGLVNVMPCQSLNEGAGIRESREDLYTDNDSEDPLYHLLHSQPDIYKYCELEFENYESANARPLKQPTQTIKIKGRKNIGRCFPGDQVVVEIFTNDNGSNELFGKVIGVLKKGDTPRVFVCMLDNYDTQVMTPIDPCVTKIYTPSYKNNPNVIAIRKYDRGNWITVRQEKLNEESKRKMLYVVEVIKWKKQFFYPLGIIIDVIPVIRGPEEGIKALNLEYHLTKTYPPEVIAEVEKYKVSSINGGKRLDIRSYCTFTIDPKNSKDLDDAISVRDLGDCYEIGIHIADIASVIPKDSALDKDARKRGCTFYSLKNVSVPMLPTKLSENLCSLLPNKDRPVISLFIQVTKKDDRVIKAKFTLATLKSNKNFSYEEAEEIIEQIEGSSLKFDSLQDCLAVAYHFSTVHRKCRLLDDWYYDQPTEECSLGKRRSHQMVEELMIMYNSFVAEYLTRKDISKNSTPLRCQFGPNPQQIKELKNKYGHLIELSVHLSYRIGASGQRVYEPKESQKRSADLQNVPNQPKRAVKSMDMRVSQCIKTEPFFPKNTFCLLTSVLNHLECAVQKRNFYKIVEIITTDDIHPELLPVIFEFRKLLGRSYIVRSNSSPLSKLGHYSMQLDSYTWASSPIRRYLDIIIQRHLHSAICKGVIQYSNQDIDILCREFTKKHKNASAYEKKFFSLNFASKLKSQNVQKLAFVLSIDPKMSRFGVCFPFNKESLADVHYIGYRDLKLMDQPIFNEEEQYTTIRWIRRLYSMESPSIHDEIKSHQSNVHTTILQSETWKEIIQSLKAENFENVVDIVKTIRMAPLTKLTPKAHIHSQNKAVTEHYINLSVNLKGGDIFQVQMSPTIKRGFLVPTVQLLNLNPKFDVCLEHSKDPIGCFAKYAIRASKSRYRNIKEYQTIWKPLCEMESVISSVEENDSIILEDMDLKWPREHSDCLKGSFVLPLEYKKEWCIECDLSKCFLCIRRRNLKLRKGGNDSAEFQDLSSECVDPACFTWIAHGVTTNAEEHKSKMPGYIEVHFKINQTSMEDTPECLFQADSKFTVELIPKLLPDVRKDQAITNLARANELVKNIALGISVSSTRFIEIGSAISTRKDFFIPKYKELGLPKLNESQNEAIRQALKHEFTVIQGPPGTGKTVVGVNIVYWFHQLNKEAGSRKQHLLPKRASKTDEAETSKKDYVLYCGPSNKSVDVVAEYLLKFTNILNPLRVYSEQMEMMEFPYPGSNLQLSRKYLREGKPKPELWSITLHHRIRMDHNPFAKEIRAFDARIKANEHITEAEVESYKKLLSKARKYELDGHDVLLCTCTAASSPTLTNKTNMRQILIDECAMATEPEAFIPLASYKPEKIVLLGDHKQLQPVVQSTLLQRLGMEKSLFERYMDKALMLDTQYRMHEDICKFPSQEFYGGHLKTDIVRPRSVFQVKKHRCTPILFCHVQGKEISLMVATEKGNENSKANLEEVNECVCVAKLLMNVAKIKSEDIAILTPYNAQVAEIKNTLQKQGITNLTVTTIMKSQGSEWRYVILSMVRSCEEAEIQRYPVKSWMAKHLGFVVNPNQVNVGITRAQEGLCIIGNRILLNCNSLWKRLLEHYMKMNSVVGPKEFSVLPR
uniref:Helicase with zinc finger 2 n=1 Tax=Erpetoichthys calabaricus TaxID=27687 RepID=A0A8C4SHS6_ERPCA